MKDSGDAFFLLFDVVVSLLSLYNYSIPDIDLLIVFVATKLFFCKECVFHATTFLFQRWNISKLTSHITLSIITISTFSIYGEKIISRPATVTILSYGPVVLCIDSIILILLKSSIRRNSSTTMTIFLWVQRGPQLKHLSFKVDKAVIQFLLHRFFFKCKLSNHVLQELNFPLLFFLNLLSVFTFLVAMPLNFFQQVWPISSEVYVLESYMLWRFIHLWLKEWLKYVFRGVSIYICTIMIRNL